MKTGGTQVPVPKAANKTKFNEGDLLVCIKSASPAYTEGGTYQVYLKINMGLVGRLKDIVKSTGCEVVLSSSWRLVGGGREFAEKSCGFQFLDETCADSDLCRGGQIQVWLDNN